MTKHGSHSMINKKQLSEFITDWHHSEGVFETPRGKFIARVKYRTARNTMLYKTISQHETKEEAQLAYDFYKKNYE